MSTDAVVRARDVIVSALGLVALTPVIVILMLGAALSTGESPLFVQTRVGRRGRQFAMVKLRTMRTAQDPHGHTLPDAARITAFGRWLRRTSLDELPGLWHVLTGQMSLVGPRPLLPEYLPRYSARQARRHEVRPGITGWAQIHGRNATTWPERLELDVWYVEHRGLALDFRILALTLLRVLQQRGISPVGGGDMEPFAGDELVTGSSGSLQEHPHKPTQ